MQIQTLKDSNKLEFRFEDEEIYDEEILDKVAIKFAELDNDQPIVIDIHGLVVLEVGMYFLHLSDLSDITLVIYDDDDYFKFIEPLIFNNMTKIKIKMKDED